MSLTEPQRALVLDWTRKLHTLEYAHRYASVSRERQNLFLGVPAVVLSGVIGAQVSTPWQADPRVQSGIAIAATLVAVLVGLQTFFKPTEIAEKHRSASATYEDFRHRLELLLVFESTASADLAKKLEQLKAEWDRLETPNVSKGAWKSAKARVAEVGTYPERLQLPAA